MAPVKEPTETDNSVEDWTPDVSVNVATAPLDEEWNGRLTRLRANGTMLYGVREKDGKGEKVIRRVMLGRGDPFTVRANKVRGHWVGPDAPSVELMFTNGEILGSVQAETKNAGITATENARGAYPGSTTAFPEGRPGLRNLDKPRATEIHRRYLGEQSELLRLEGQEARADKADANSAIAALVEALTGKKDDNNAWPGAEGPGTGPVKATGSD